MGRKKSYSSTLSGIITSLKLNLDNLVKFSQEELPSVLADAEAYQELKPVIEKLIRPATIEQTGKPLDQQDHKDQQDQNNTTEQKPPARTRKKKGQSADGENTNNQEPGIDS